MKISMWHFCPCLDQLIEVFFVGEQFYCNSTKEPDRYDYTFIEADFFGELGEPWSAR